MNHLQILAIHPTL